MTRSPLVSVVIPVYNAEKTIVRSVESVLSQVCTDWELLLIDDCSTDRSVEILRDFGSTDDRIFVIQLEANSGAAEARNTGVRVAKGRFIAFLDSDDLWLPKKLEVQVSRHLETGVAITFTDYEWIDASERSMGVVVRAGSQPTWSEMTWGNNIGLSTAMIDRELVGNPIMKPLRLNHDFALWLELFRKGCSAERIPEVLTLYRVHSGSLSENKLESTFTNWRILHKIEGLSVPRTIIRMFVWGIRTTARRFLAKFPR